MKKKKPKPKLKPSNIDKNGKLIPSSEEVYRIVLYYSNLRKNGLLEDDD